MTTGKPGTGRRALTMRHKDIVESDGPALPVPSARFIPMVRHEPMRRSTRRERMEEIRPEWRRFFAPWNVPDAELTPEERKRWQR